MPRRLGGVDLFKHVLALSVVLIHTRTSLYSQETLAFSDYVTDWVDGAVMGFFLISGFFFPLGRFPCGKGEFVEFARARAYRLLVPFFVFSTFYSVAMTVLGKGALYDGLWLTITLHGSSMQLYFLPLLFGCEVLCATWSNLLSEFKQSRRIGAAFMLILALISLSFPTEFSTGSDPRLFPLYLLAFSIGITVRRSNSPNLTMLLVVAAAALFSIKDDRFADIALVTALFWAALTASRSWKGLNRSFPGSGGVYLLHTTITNFAIAHILAKFGVAQIPNLIISVVLTYLVCLSATLIASRLAPKFRFLLLE